jgi:hypothetical protein
MLSIALALADRVAESRQTIYFLGDVHGRFDHVTESALAGRRPDAVVFLGNLQPARPFMEEIAPLLDAGIDVRWIRGSHDSDTRENWDKLAGAMHLNIDGQVVEIAGLRVAGLGGVFRGEVWHPDSGAERWKTSKRPSYRSRPDYAASLDAETEQVRLHKTLKHQSTIFWDEYVRLHDQDADILVTQEAPSCHPHGFAVIDDLAQAMGVSRLFHGRHHDSPDYRAWDYQLRFKAYGVGLRGITDMEGRIIRPGEVGR